jgi:hypothetical protein
MFDIHSVNLVPVALNGLMLLLAVLKLFGKHNQTIERIRSLTQDLSQYQSPTSEEGTHLSTQEKALLIDKLEKVLQELKNDNDKP